MILAIQENLVPGETVADRLAFALDAGFDGLELRDAARPGLEPVRGRAPTACPELDGWLGDFDPVRAAAPSTGCAASSTASPRWAAGA